MSKFNREITAVFDDAFKQATGILPKIIELLMDDNKSTEEVQDEFNKMMEEAKPKTYEDYIEDIKQIFKQAGWKEPDAKND